MPEVSPTGTLGRVPILLLTRSIHFCYFHITHLPVSPESVSPSLELSPEAQAYICSYLRTAILFTPHDKAASSCLQPSALPPKLRSLSSLLQSAQGSSWLLSPLHSTLCFQAAPLPPQLRPSPHWCFPNHPGPSLPLVKF